MENDYNYILNLVYEKPIINSDNSDNNDEVISIDYERSSLGYDGGDDAKSAYDLFIEKGFVQFDTKIGSVAFKLVSVELVDIQKHIELSEELEEDEVENEN